jgi:hypothetical protein
MMKWVELNSNRINKRKKIEHTHEEMPQHKIGMRIKY